MACCSSIEWTESTWNPLTGCTKISPGCKNCYAHRMAKRLQAMGNPSYANGFKLTMHKHVLELPLQWRRPRTIFVNSMSDLFHKDVPFEFISDVFDVMSRARQHQFQILTKRSRRLRQLADKLPWPDNVWMGVSVESKDFLPRIRDLGDVPAAIKFVSLEPLLGPIHRFPFRHIDWVILGGESGPRARPMNLEWVRSIRDQCSDADVPFFFKQWGGWNKKKNGRALDGRTWDEMPRAASC